MVKIEKSNRLLRKAKKIIPGGNMILSKNPERFLPDYWPTYFKKAKGCKIVDLDGNEYLDFSLMGVGTNVLGYANKHIDNQVKKRLASPIGKDLNFALIWDNYNDVDLHVKTPNGTFINFQRKNYAGGHLDVDKNVASHTKVPNPIENIRWDRNAPKRK